MNHIRASFARVVAGNITQATLNHLSAVFRKKLKVHGRKFAVENTHRFCLRGLVVAHDRQFVGDELTRKVGGFGKSVVSVYMVVHTHSRRHARIKMLICHSLPS